MMHDKIPPHVVLTSEESTGSCYWRLFAPFPRQAVIETAVACCNMITNRSHQPSRGGDTREQVDVISFTERAQHTQVLTSGQDCAMSSGIQVVRSCIRGGEGPRMFVCGVIR